MAQPKTLTHYDILGITPAATQADVKSAYRKLALKLHPDTGAASDQATRLFDLVTVAYNVLADPVQRKMYDSSLTTSTQPQSAPSPSYQHPQSAPTTVPRPQPMEDNWNFAPMYTPTAPTTSAAKETGRVASEPLFAQTPQQNSRWLWWCTLLAGAFLLGTFVHFSLGSVLELKYAIVSALLTSVAMVVGAFFRVRARPVSFLEMVAAALLLAASVAQLSWWTHWPAWVVGGLVVIWWEYLASLPIPLAGMSFAQWWAGCAGHRRRSFGHALLRTLQLVVAPVWYVVRWTGHWLASSR